MTKKVVALLFGGCSSEHDVSKKSAKTILDNIDRDKYTVLPVYITKEGKWLIYDGPVSRITESGWEEYASSVILSPDRVNKGLYKVVGDKIKKISIDVVFPVLHGKYGEDGTIQGIFEMAGIKYVGCGVLSSAVSMDKAYTKIVADSIGINQAESVVCYKYEIDDAKTIEKIESKLPYPVFVKPSNAGSSVGVTKAVNRQELINSLKIAGENDNTIIVEREIIGRELECAVLGNLDARASCVGEILSAADFYDYDAKYNNPQSMTVIPADIPKEKSEQIRQSALKIYKALSCKGLARVDFFLEKDTNRVIFNEINTMPGFTSISMYPMLFRQEGIETKELIDNLIQLACE